MTAKPEVTLPVLTAAEAEHHCDLARDLYADALATSRREAAARARIVIDNAWKTLEKESRGLSDLSGVRSPEAQNLLRFFPEVPLSQDDLGTLVSLVDNPELSLAQKRNDVIVREILGRKVSTARGKRHMQALFRDCAAAARDRAFQEKVRTTRRMLDSDLQQEYLEQAVARHGYTLWGAQAPITAVKDLPVGLHTEREHLVGTSKADLAVRLWSGTLLAVEAKHSGSRTNSHKRLVYEAGTKARGWRQRLGSKVTVVTYLTGNVSPAQVLYLQEQGSRVVFSHDTSKFEKLLGHARPRVSRTLA